MNRRDFLKLLGAVGANFGLGALPTSFIKGGERLNADWLEEVAKVFLEVYKPIAEADGYREACYVLKELNEKELAEKYLFAMVKVTKKFIDGGYEFERGTVTIREHLERLESALKMSTLAKGESRLDSGRIEPVVSRRQITEMESVWHFEREIEDHG